jgi:hypothetical protein
MQKQPLFLCTPDLLFPTTWHGYVASFDLDKSELLELLNIFIQGLSDQSTWYSCMLAWLNWTHCPSTTPGAAFRHLTGWTWGWGAS